jgi:hypothetical protein
MNFKKAYLENFRLCKTDKERIGLIKKIFADGFVEGQQDGEKIYFEESKNGDTFIRKGNNPFTAECHINGRLVDTIALDKISEEVFI